MFFWFNQIFRTWKQSTALLLAQLHENQHVWGNQNSQTELTCPLCPHGAAPNLCSAVACSARSDSSGSVGRRARPPTGLPRASCHSGPDETLGRWRRHREKNRRVGVGVTIKTECKEMNQKRKWQVFVVVLFCPAECGRLTARAARRTSLLLAL